MALARLGPKGTVKTATPMPRSMKPRVKWERASSIAETRLTISLALIVLTYLTELFPAKASIRWALSGYIIATLLCALLYSATVPRKRVRILADLTDLLAISALVKLTGGIDSPWFLLYVFPVMSTSWYLGPAWSVGFA